MANIQFTGLEIGVSQLGTEEVIVPPRQRLEWNRTQSSIARVQSSVAKSSVTPAASYASGVPLSRTQPVIKIRRRTQFILRCGSDQNSLATALRGTSNRELKVLAQCAVPDCQGITWLLVVDDERLGRELLIAAGLPHRSEFVLLVEVVPRFGAATRLSRCLDAAKVDVLYSYAVPTTADRLTAVFKTADDEYTARVLQTVASAAEGQFPLRNDLAQRDSVLVAAPESTAERPILTRPLGRSVLQPRATVY